MKKKQIAGAAAASGLAAIMIIQGAYAYLTDTAEKKNEFTVGKVDIGLEEKNFEEEKAARNTDNLVCNQTVKKDPVIRLQEGSADAVVFLEVTMPTAAQAKFVNQNGTEDKDNAGAGDELFYFTSAAAGSGNGTSAAAKVENSQSTFDPSWILLSHESNTYVFGYTKKLTNSDKQSATSPLFDQVQLRNYVDTAGKDTGNASSSTSILITAKAIQSSFIGEEGANKGTTENPYTQTELAAIYSILDSQGNNGTT